MRGPRPRSVKWPPATARPTVNTVTGRWRQPGPKRSPTGERPSNPDSAMSAAHQKVTSLEAALATLQKAKEAAREGFHRKFHRKVSEAHRGSGDQEGRRGRTLRASDAMAEPIAAGDVGPGFRTASRGQWPRIVFRSGCVAGEGCRAGGTCTSISSKFGRCSPEHSCESGETSFGDVFRRRGSIHGSTILRVVGWMNCELRDALDVGDIESAITLSGLISRGAAKKASLVPLPLSPAWCREEGDIVGHARRPRRGGFPPRSSRFLAEDPGASPVSEPQCRSSGWWRGRFHALMRLGEGPSLPTPSVLAVATQPTAEIEIQDSTIWDGSSDGEPLVRPNNGRHVASRIGDTVRDRSVYCGRFSVLSEDTANSVHSGTRRLSLMFGGVPVTQLDAVNPHEAPMEVSQFNLAQSQLVWSQSPRTGSMMILQRKTMS